MLQVHDNLILSYTVDFKDKTLVLVTEYWDGNYHETNTLLFSGVIAHAFNQIGEQLSVIFDIEQHDGESFITDQSELLKKYKNYSWPFKYENDADLNNILKSRNIKYFVLAATYGLDGFILAENVEMTVSH